MPAFDGIDSLEGQEIGVEKVSIAAMVLLGEGEGTLPRQGAHLSDRGRSAGSS